MIEHVVLRKRKRSSVPLEKRLEKVRKKLRNAKRKPKRDSRTRRVAARTQPAAEQTQPSAEQTRRVAARTRRVAARKQRVDAQTQQHAAGDVCPWWKQQLQPLYAQVPLGSPGESANMTCLASAPGKQPATSWFSVTSHPLVESAAGPDEGGAAHTWRSRMAFEKDDVWSAEAGAGHKAASAKKGKELAPEPLVQERSLKTMMRLTREQKRKLKSWMGAYRFTYNKAVELVRRNSKWIDSNGQYLAEHLVNESKNGRSTRVNKSSSQEEKDESALRTENQDAKRAWLGVEVGYLVKLHPWLLEVPNNIRKEAVRDVMKAQQSNDAMRKAKPQHRWRLKFKTRNSPSAWTIAVPMKYLSSSKVLPRPETRRPRTDGAAHDDIQKGIAPRSWTKVNIARTYGLGDFWLVEPVPGGAITKE